MMEFADFNITSQLFSIHLGIIYRPSEGSVLQFSQELADYLEKNITSPGDLLMMGDFNVPTNAISNPDTILLMDILESFRLRNHINFATHLILLS